MAGLYGLLGAFLSIGAIWVTHHNTFTRVARFDPVVVVLNLLLLLGASLVPWPTALLSEAIGSGRYPDEVAANVVYLIVSTVLIVGWVVLLQTLSRRPHLLATVTNVRWMRRYSCNSAFAGLVAHTATAVAP